MIVVPEPPSREGHGLNLARGFTAAIGIRCSSISIVRRSTRAFRPNRRHPANLRRIPPHKFTVGDSGQIENLVQEYVPGGSWSLSP